MENMSRTIVISSPINSDVAGTVIGFISEINAMDYIATESNKDYEPQPIEMIINSGGGSATDGFAIIDAMKMSHTPIATVGLGMVGSMALGIFVSGDYRYSGKHTRFLYHSVSYGAEGTIRDHEDSHKEANRLQDMYNKLFSDTKFSKEVMENVREHKLDYMMSAYKAKHYGIVDAIIN